MLVLQTITVLRSLLTTINKFECAIARYQLARIRATSNKERQVQSPVTIFCNLAIALSPTGYHAVRCDHANRPGTQRCSDTECDFQANRPAERECFIGNSSCVRHVLPLIIARGYVNAHLVGPASAHTNHRPTNHTKTVSFASACTCTFTINVVSS